MVLRGDVAVLGDTMVLGGDVTVLGGDIAVLGGDVAVLGGNSSWMNSWRYGSQELKYGPVVICRWEVMV